jgi:cathepsin L
LPEAKTWEHLDSIKADTDQAGCGSCWAVATATALNAGAELNGINRTFSAQEFVCEVPNVRNCGGQGGCEGSTIELALHYTMEHGVETQAGRPYRGSEHVCDKSPPHLESDEQKNDKTFEAMIAVGKHLPLTAQSPGPSLGLHSWERLPENKYEPLMRAVAEHGPVAVYVSARGWHLFHGGVFDSCDKDAVIDHAVTLIGYGKSQSTAGEDKYWLIKNSWGLTWGDAGTIKLMRRDDDETKHCGIDKQPELGTGCEGGPVEVTVCGMCGILYDPIVPYFKPA